MAARFADRTAWNLTPNAWADRRRALEASGVPLLDLTASNPTQCGIECPETMLAALADPAARQYAPAPFGLPAARAAVSGWCARRGVVAAPDQVILTASTSEAYHHLFRLLANPGDQVLVPAPSYPLLEYLAGLDDLQAVPYPLRVTDRWRLDLDALRAAVAPTTRAILVVHPHNPTGAGLTVQEAAGVAALCRRHQLALIADEVFADYWFFDDPAVPPTVGAPPEVLTFRLGGLSKSAGLPQMKLGWMLVDGPPALRRQALARLEVIADTYLSVNTPVQQAWPAWGAAAEGLQSQIRARVLGNRRWLAGQLSRPAASAGGGLTTARWPAAALLPADGGWSAVLRVPAIQDDEAWALARLEQDHLVIHPGYFFEFPEPGFVVVSLLTPSDRFRDGLGRLLASL